MTLAKELVALFTRAWIEIISLFFIIPWISVALFTRAWIEIGGDNVVDFIIYGRPLYEGVDWNSYDASKDALYNRRPLHEGVDWNPGFITSTCGGLSRPLHEGVDWNIVFYLSLLYMYKVALFTRAWIEIPDEWNR